MSTAYTTTATTGGRPSPTPTPTPAEMLLVDTGVQLPVHEQFRCALLLGV